MIAAAVATATTVLIVDDESLIRAIVSEALSDAGCLVYDAQHAAEAIGILEHNFGGIHVMVTDVTMPGDMDGVGLAHHASRNWPAIKILVVSAKPRHMLPSLPRGRDLRVSHIVVRRSLSTLGSFTRRRTHQRHGLVRNEAAAVAQFLGRRSALR